MKNEEPDIRLYFDQPHPAPMAAPYMDADGTLGVQLTAEGYNVAIVGVQSEYHSLANKGCALAPDAIRKYLYALCGSFKNIKIADLGNIKAGKTERDTLFALKSVVTHLDQHHVTTVVLGGTQDLTVPIYMGLKSNRKEMTMAVIDSRIDAQKAAGKFNSQSWMNKLTTDKALKKCDLLAFQGYLISEHQYEALLVRNLIDPQYRLGKLRNNLIAAEPVLRDADLLSFDINAIRQADAPGCGTPSPNGLTGEEACQLMRLAGCSDRIGAMGLFEVNPNADQGEQTAALSAQLTWHFLEALDNRIGDYPAQSISKYQKYVVPITDDTDMIFFHGQLRNRWWMAIPMKDKTRIVACSASDYEQASNSKAPDIWYRYFMK